MKTAATATHRWRGAAAEEKTMVGGDLRLPESDLMLCGDLYFDDLLDFSFGDGDEDLSEPLPCPSWEEPFLRAPPPPPPAAASAQEHGLPCDDLEVAQLEWLSHFVEDSFASGAGEVVVMAGSGYRTPSPVSVLEQSNLQQLSPPPCSPGFAAPRAPRTKRPRPAAFNSLLPFAPPPPAEGRDAKRAKVRKVKAVSAAAAEPLQPAGGGARRCLHCETQKTPQWRAGPMGPKTLCNACGVRYKTGRLFPEYRPAASPTFSSAVHSNSHKKVVEMRSLVPPAAAASTAAPLALKGCELVHYIRLGSSGNGLQC